MGRRPENFKIKRIRRKFTVERDILGKQNRQIHEEKMEIYIKIAENWWKIIKKMKCKSVVKKKTNL